ncbi:MAG: transcriptional initiation protein Tat [Nitrospiraceae bacterium]|nr:transcriptional initiation protein Tat [Nitrospiraceae bacterium]
MSRSMSRREMMGMVAMMGTAGLGLALGNGKLPLASASEHLDLEPRGDHQLHALLSALAKVKKRRDYRNLTMISLHRDEWDHEAIALLLHYHGKPKQVWDNTVFGSPWLNLMRNSLNAQVYSFGKKDALVLSATHGTAHLALFDDKMWEKYRLYEKAEVKSKTNPLVRLSPASSKPLSSLNDPHGVLSPEDNNIPVLQARGVVFLACHNMIWELSGALKKGGINPDHKTHGEIAAELTNHLIPGVVLTPGIVGTLPLLAEAGYQYAHS